MTSCLAKQSCSVIKFHFGNSTIVGCFSSGAFGTFGYHSLLSTLGGNAEADYPPSDEPDSETHRGAEKNSLPLSGGCRRSHPWTLPGGRKRWSGGGCDPHQQHAPRYRPKIARSTFPWRRNQKDRGGTRFWRIFLHFQLGLYGEQGGIRLVIVGINHTIDVDPRESLVQ